MKLCKTQKEVMTFLAALRSTDLFKRNNDNHKHLSYLLTIVPETFKQSYNKFYLNKNFSSLHLESLISLELTNPFNDNKDLLEAISFYISMDKNIYDEGLEIEYFTYLDKLNQEVPFHFADLSACLIDQLFHKFNQMKYTDTPFGFQQVDFFIKNIDYLPICTQEYIKDKKYELELDKENPITSIENDFQFEVFKNNLNEDKLLEQFHYYYKKFLNFHLNKSEVVLKSILYLFQSFDNETFIQENETIYNQKIKEFLHTLNNNMYKVFNFKEYIHLFKSLSIKTQKLFLKYFNRSLTFQNTHKISPYLYYILDHSIGLNLNDKKNYYSQLEQPFYLNVNIMSDEVFEVIIKEYDKQLKKDIEEV